MTLSATQRWHIREGWKAGEDPAYLAQHYGVAPSVIDHEIRILRAEIEGRQKARTERDKAASRVEEPTRGLRCQVCSMVRVYGTGTPSLVPGVLLARCARCGRQTGHRKIEGEDRDRQPVTTAPDHAVARRTDPETSHEAARSVTGLRESQAEVLGVIRRRGPMTDEEVLAVLRDRAEYPWTPSGARTRRSELVTAGMVRDSGRRKRLATGRRSILWEAVSR